MYDRDNVDDHARGKRGEDENLAFPTELYVAQKYDWQRGQEYVGETVRCHPREKKSYLMADDEEFPRLPAV